MRSQEGTVLRSHGPGPELAVEEISQTAGPGETLVEMRLAAVTSQDRMVLSGKQPAAPFTPGSEGFGVVISSSVAEVGAGVVLHGEGIGVTRPGVWGRYAVVPDAAVHPLPASLEPTTALALLTPALTAHTAVRRVGQVLAGETVVVTGITGLVARLCAAVARSAGAARVIGLAGVMDSVTLVGDLVDQIVRVDELGQVGRDLPWCDLAVDTLGGPVTSGVLGHITPGGRIALLGYKTGEFTTLDLHQLIGRDLRVLPVNVQRTTLEPGAVGQALADIAPARLQPEVELVPVGRISEVLDRSASATRFLLDLTVLS